MLWRSMSPLSIPRFIRISRTTIPTSYSRSQPSDIGSQSIGNTNLLPTQSTAETNTQTQNTFSIDHPRSQLPAVGSPSDAQVLSSVHVDLILPMQSIGRAEPGPRTQDAVSMDHSRSRSLGVGSPSHTGLQSSAQTTAPICSLLLDFSSLIMTATSTATESKTSDEQVRYTIMFVRKVKNTIITHPIPYLLPFASTNSLGLMQREYGYGSEDTHPGEPPRQPVYLRSPLGFDPYDVESYGSAQVAHVQPPSDMMTVSKMLYDQNPAFDPKCALVNGRKSRNATTTLNQEFYNKNLERSVAIVARSILVVNAKIASALPIRLARPYTGTSVPFRSMDTPPFWCTFYSSSSAANGGKSAIYINGLREYEEHVVGWQGSGEPSDH
jgi:hypothetical protein